MATLDTIITCRHRGEIVETRPSTQCGCQGDPVPVYQCLLHNTTCTVKRCDRGQEERICFRCEDRNASTLATSIRIFLNTD